MFGNEPFFVLFSHNFTFSLAIVFRNFAHGNAFTKSAPKSAANCAIASNAMNRVLPFFHVDTFVPDFVARRALRYAAFVTGTN